MARLPIPGGDDGTWGDILNDYLSQVQNADGSLKNSIVTPGNVSALNAPAAGNVLSYTATGFQWVGASAHSHAAGDVTSGTFGIARLPVAASGTSSATQVVRADDTRLLSNVTRVLHNGTNYPARPTGAAYVEWVGPTQPSGAVNGDTWVNTT